jgi:putative acetyltransferase
MHIALERPDQPEVVSLVEELDAYQKPLYPPESHHGIDIESLGQPNVLFAVVRNTEGRAVGCGAVVMSTEYGELKRMFVRPQHRGQGIAKALLAFLEAEAIAKGCTLLMLETGVSQPKALGLYERAGYVRCGPFGSYTNDPFSVFMHKQVGG